MNWKQISSELSDEEFELLLRDRLQVALSTLPPNTTMIMLMASTSYGSANMLKEVEWHIGSTDNTKGEILGQCVVEHNRRNTFRQSCTLKLLEATAELEPIPQPSVAKPISDEIPF
jgi:hypothetical protein